MSIHDLGKEINSKYVLVSLKASQWGNFTKLGNSNGKTEEEKAMIREVGMLVNPENLGLDKIQKLVTAARNFLDTYSLPFGIDGVKIIPRKIVPEVHDQLKKLRVKFEELVSIAEDKYREEVYRIASIYPNYFGKVRHKYPLSLEGRFALNWKFFPVNAQELDGDLDPEIIRESNAQMHRELSDLRVSVVQEMRKRLIGAASHLRNKLQSGEIFRDSTVNKLRERIELFSKMNVWDDSEVVQMVNHMKEMLGGTTPDDLRDEGVFRKRFTDELDKVVADMQSIYDGDEEARFIEM